MESMTSNKSYIECYLSETPELFDGGFSEYEVSDEVLRNLSKDLGFSYDFYKNLSSVNREQAHNIVAMMSRQKGYDRILLLLDEEIQKCTYYSLTPDRPPILNSDFFNIATSLLSTSDEVTIAEKHYHKDDDISYMIIKKAHPMTVVEKYENAEDKEYPYELGIILVNDEKNTTYSRLVLYMDGHPIYMPASYYSSSTARFARSTSSSRDALEVLILKIIDDLREDILYSKLYEFHFKYRANKQVILSYEEYNAILRTLRKIPTIIDEPSYLDSFIALGEQFEKRYSQLEDQRSSYIWRCTALSLWKVESMINTVSTLLNEVNAPPIEYFSIRELLGNYISTNRNAVEIAKEDLC